MRPEQEMAERNNVIERAAEIICNSSAGTPQERATTAAELLNSLTVPDAVQVPPEIRWHNPTPIEQKLDRIIEQLEFICNELREDHAG